MAALGSAGAVRLWDEATFKVNYPPYNAVRPMPKYCRVCGKETPGFDERGPLCIDCAVAQALEEDK